MRILYNYKSKNYPKAPSLTQKSETIGKLTTPWCSLIIGALPGIFMDEMDPLRMPISAGAVILMLILMPIIRKILFKGLDKKYAAMLAGKIPMK